MAGSPSTPACSRRSRSRSDRADQARPGRFGVVGYDRSANTAPIEPGDVRLEYDRNLLDITPAGDGGTVGGNNGSGGALVNGKLNLAIAAGTAAARLPSRRSRSTGTSAIRRAVAITIVAKAAGTTVKANGAGPSNQPERSPTPPTTRAPMKTP